MNTHDTSLLLSAAKLGTLELSNRMIMAPMTRGRAGPDETRAPSLSSTTDSGQRRA